MVVSIPRQISPLIGSTPVEAHTKTEDGTVKTRFPKKKRGDLCLKFGESFIKKKTEFSKKE